MAVYTDKQGKQWAYNNLTMPEGQAEDLSIKVYHLEDQVKNLLLIQENHLEECRDRLAEKDLEIKILKESLGKSELELVKEITALKRRGHV